MNIGKARVQAFPPDWAYSNALKDHECQDGTRVPILGLVIKLRSLKMSSGNSRQTLRLFRVNKSGIRKQLIVFQQVPHHFSRSRMQAVIPESGLLGFAAPHGRVRWWPAGHCRQLPLRSCSGFRLTDFSPQINLFVVDEHSTSRPTTSPLHVVNSHLTDFPALVKVCN